MSINRALREYTTLPSIPQPFPSTGSFDFRHGVFNERPMTVQEQNFEQFVNARQAEYDISSFMDEWERLRAHEEAAIQLWQDLDGNLAEYQRQMRTRDQQETEHQCQRKKEKALRLEAEAQRLKVYEQECLNAAACRAFKEAVKRRVFLEAVSCRAREFERRRAFTEAQIPGAMQLAARRPLMEAVKRRAREITERWALIETLNRNFADFAEVASATDGICSDLDTPLTSSGESSHSPSPQQSGSADSVFRDQGSPFLPTKQPIENTGQTPRNSPRQPPTLTQPSQDSSNSPSPPRSSSVENSTPPSSKQSSPPESLKSSPPKRPTGWPFEADPAIWGTSILPSSSNHLSQSPSPSPVPQLPSPNHYPTSTSVPRHGAYDTRTARLNSIRYQQSQLVPTGSTNQPMPWQQRTRNIPTHRFVQETKPPGWDDTFVEIIRSRPPAWGVGRE